MNVAIGIFYRAPTPPKGLFDQVLALTTLANDVKTRSFTSLIKATSFPAPTRSVSLKNIMPHALLTVSV
jgi:hypothetical protein